MQYIANILTRSLFDDKTHLFNVVNKKEDLIKGLPTLCIGLELTKENFPEYNIISMDIDDLTKWTYGPREKRNIYEYRLSKFMHDSMNKYVNNVHYQYVNVMMQDAENDGIKKISKLLNPTSDDKKTTSYIYNGMAYIYDYETKFVYGVSIRELKYCNYNYKKFLSMVHDNTRVISDTNSIPFDMRMLFSDRNYIIPSIFY